MTEGEFLCAKNIVRERDPDAFATAAKEMGNALWTVADMQQDKQINWPSNRPLRAHNSRSGFERGIKRRGG